MDALQVLWWRGAGIERLAAMEAKDPAAEPELSSSMAALSQDIDLTVRSEPSFPRRARSARGPPDTLPVRLARVASESVAQSRVRAASVGGLTGAECGAGS